MRKSDIFDRISIDPPAKARKKDIFDRIDYKDVFSRIKIDLETLLEKKIGLTDDVKAYIDRAIKTAVSEAQKKDAREDLTENDVSRLIKKEIAAHEAKERNEAPDPVLESLKAELAKLAKDLKRTATDIRDEIRQPKYTFGGFSPQTNDLNIGDPSVEGAWRIVKSGTDLSFQRYESGVWTEKGAMTP